MRKVKMWVLLGMTFEDAESEYEYTPVVIATMCDTMYDVLPVEDFDKWLAKQKEFFCGPMIQEYTFREIWVELDGEPLAEMFKTTTVEGTVTTA